jgi:hypothetical protein
MAISQALKSLRRRIPSARLYAFHADIEEVPVDRDFFGTFPPTGASRWGRRFANTTDLGYCLGRIAPLNPTKTILFSDGACRNKRNTLRVVEQMTGSIDAFFCEPDPAHYDENHPTGRTAEQMFQLLTRDADEGLMQQIARCGRGRFIRFHPDRVNLQSELAISTEETAPMRRRHPDHHVPGDQINVVVPEPRFFDARQHVHVQHAWSFTTMTPHPSISTMARPPLRTSMSDRPKFGWSAAAPSGQSCCSAPRYSPRRLWRHHSGSSITSKLRRSRPRRISMRRRRRFIAARYTASLSRSIGPSPRPRRGRSRPDSRSASPTSPSSR